MKALRRLGLLVGAMMALAAFAAAPALADDGNIVIDDGDPCAVTFNYNGTVPGSGNLSDIADDDCQVEGLSIDLSDSDLDASFVDGDAELDGTVTVSVFGGLVECNYSGTLTGTYVPSNHLPSGWYYFDISGVVTADPGNSFLCPPGPMNVRITGHVQG